MSASCGGGDSGAEEAGNAAAGGATPGREEFSGVGSLEILSGFPGLAGSATASRSKRSGFWVDCATRGSMAGAGNWLVEGANEGSGRAGAGEGGNAGAMALGASLASKRVSSRRGWADAAPLSGAGPFIVAVPNCSTGSAAAGWLETAAGGRAALAAGALAGAAARSDFDLLHAPQTTISANQAASNRRSMAALPRTARAARSRARTMGHFNGAEHSAPFRSGPDQSLFIGLGWRLACFAPFTGLPRLHTLLTLAATAVGESTS